MRRKEWAGPRPCARATAEAGAVGGGLSPWRPQRRGCPRPTRSPPSVRGRGAGAEFAPWPCGRWWAVRPRPAPGLGRGRQVGLGAGEIAVPLRPSVRLLAGGEVAVPLQAAAGPPETWSLCFQAGGKADAVTTLRGSCAGSARSSPGAGCGGAGFCEKCSGCRFLWLEIWFRSLWRWPGGSSCVFSQRLEIKSSSTARGVLRSRVPQRPSPSPFRGGLSCVSAVRPGACVLHASWSVLT